MNLIQRLDEFPPPALSAQAHVYTVSVQQIDSHVVQFLDKTEQARARRFINPQHGRHFSLVRGLLRQWLGYYLSQPPASVEFHYNPHGRPSVAAAQDNPPLHFNISHSHGMAAFSFCRQHIGIDIEYKKHINNLTAMTQHICHPGELLEFQSLSKAEAVDAFFRLWSRKEAYIKANGQGLSMGLRSIYIGTAVTSVIQQVNYKNTPQFNWRIQDLPCNTGYQLAVAIDTMK